VRIEKRVDLMGNIESYGVKAEESASYGNDRNEALNADGKCR